MYEIYERILKEKGLKSADVSRATGISQGVFADWKKGRYTPKDDKRKAIAEFLGVTLEYLDTGTNPDGYYYDKDTAELAQEIYQNKELHMLLDAARDSSAAELKDFYDMLVLMKRREKGR